MTCAAGQLYKKNVINFVNMCHILFHFSIKKLKNQLRTVFDETIIYAICVLIITTPFEKAQMIHIRKKTLITLILALTAGGVRKIGAFGVYWC